MDMLQMSDNIKQYYQEHPYPERSYHRESALYALSVNKKTSEHMAYNANGDIMQLELPRNLLLVALHKGDLKPGPFDPVTPQPEDWETVCFYGAETEPSWV